MDDIKREISHSAMTLDALTLPQVKLLFQQKLLQKRGLNPLADVDKFASINDQTILKYLNKLLASVKKGKLKPTSRVEPYQNIRNAISKAAGFTALARVCRVEHWHTDDEVGMFIFGWHQTKPKLVSTDEANKWLRANNVSLSTSADPDQQRCAHVGTLQQPATGGLTAFYVRITDSNFPAVFRHDNPTVHKPVIMLLNPDTNCYLVMCHPSVSDTVVSEYIAKNISCPAIFKKQEEAIKRDIESATLGEHAGMVFSSQSQPLDPEPLDPGYL
jgi:hypothetical protein